MAIDTAEKRKNVACIGFTLNGAGVTPNASMDREWRQQSGYGYSGIEPSATLQTETFGNKTVHLGISIRL